MRRILLLVGLVLVVSCTQTGGSKPATTANAIEAPTATSVTPSTNTSVSVAGCSFFAPQRIDESRLDDLEFRQSHPVMAAAAEGDLRGMDVLLASGADPDENDERDGLNALTVAARSGCVETMQELVEAGASLRPSGYAGPLVGAVQSFNPKAVQYLLEAGADPNWVSDAPNSEQPTALWMAASWGLVDIMEKLVDAGADIDRPNRLGETPVFAAAASVGETTVALKWLLAHGAAADNRALIAAAMDGRMERVRVLVEAGADPTFEGSSGLNAIEVARMEGHEDIARYLEGEEE